MTKFKTEKDIIKSEVTEFYLIEVNADGNECEILTYDALDNIIRHRRQAIRSSQDAEAANWNYPSWKLGLELGFFTPDQLKEALIKDVFPQYFTTGISEDFLLDCLDDNFVDWLIKSMNDGLYEFLWRHCGDDKNLFIPAISSQPKYEGSLVYITRVLNFRKDIKPGLFNVYIPSTKEYLEAVSAGTLMISKEAFNLIGFDIVEKFYRYLSIEKFLHLISLLNSKSSDVESLIGADILDVITDAIGSVSEAKEAVVAFYKTFIDDQTSYINAWVEKKFADRGARFKAKKVKKILKAYYAQELRIARTFEREAAERKRRQPSTILNRVQNWVVKTYKIVKQKDVDAFLCIDYLTVFKPARILCWLYGEDITQEALIKFPLLSEIGQNRPVRNLHYDNYPQSVVNAVLDICSMKNATLTPDQVQQLTRAYQVVSDMCEQTIDFRLERLKMDASKKLAEYQ